MDKTILPIESIKERDVDFIILEELCTDNTFCEWFVRELSLPHFASLNGAWRSITDFGLGETDILFSYNSYEGKVIVLIENKLDAEFQDEQYTRYEKRAKEYMNQKMCDMVYSVLLAPQLYCENQNEFDNYLSYEDVASRLEFNGSKRNLFKAELLKIAAEKLRRGYQPVNSLPVQKFWHSYWDYKEEKHPSLYMKKPDIVPQNSDWPMLFDDRLKGVIFYHKLAQGNVDATFRRFSDEFEYKVKKQLLEGAQIEKHKKSFSVRIFSGVVDRTKEFITQTESVEVGLQNIERLRNWLIDCNLLGNELK